jgi:hypothetical protein
VIDRVRQKFGIDLIIRAHQVKFKSPSFDLLIANSLRAFSGGVGWIRILQWYANIWTHHNLHSSTLLRDVSSGIPFFICKSIPNSHSFFAGLTIRVRLCVSRAIWVSHSRSVSLHSSILLHEY